MFSTIYEKGKVVIVSSRLDGHFDIYEGEYDTAEEAHAKAGSLNAEFYSYNVGTGIAEPYPDGGLSRLKKKAKI